jgi:Secretion system C-terminal sorting domain
VNTPNALNPGQLGAIISSPANLGNLTIQRMQKPFLSNGAVSIRRSYLIQPQTDTGLKATLRFSYLDADLNGENPATLMLWKSDDGIVWTGFKPDSLNSIGELQFAEKSGIDSFSIWTLADGTNALAVYLSSFSAVCQNDYALVRWHTGSELQVAHFEVERSLDGTTWTFLQNFIATNSPVGSAYSYQDHSPQPAAFYRLKIVYRSGTEQYSPVFSGGCADLAFPITGYPNPVEQDVTLRLGLRAAAEGRLQLVNASGEVVSVRNWSLTTGINQITLSLSGLAPGLYIARLITGQGHYQIRLMKK